MQQGGLGVKRNCEIGGVLKHNGGYGFKITFDDKDSALYYKDMMYWIIKNDNFNMNMKDGYYERDNKQR